MLLNVSPEPDPCVGEALVGPLIFGHDRLADGEGAVFFRLCRQVNRTVTASAARAANPNASMMPSEVAAEVPPQIPGFPEADANRR